MDNRMEYPGKLSTPAIGWNGGTYWEMNFEDREKLRKEAIAREAAYRNSLKGRIEHKVWCWRGKMADWIAPEGWNDDR